MKEFTLKNIIDCPVCGSSVILRRNASKDFQIYCPTCKAHSEWMRKADTIIQWYNMVIQYQKNNSK